MTTYGPIVYRVESIGTGWQLVAEQPGKGCQVVVQSTPSESKERFENVCRDYVRTSSLAAVLCEPRRLLLCGPDGKWHEDASYSGSYAALVG